MKPLPILSIDPGTTRCGHARITLHRSPVGGRLVYDRGGHRELDRGWLTAELQQLRADGGIFALEVLIGGRFKGRLTSSLNETAEMQGRILGVAAACGFEPPRPELLPLVEQTGVWTLLIPAGDGTIKRVMGRERVRSPRTGSTYTRNATERVRIAGWRGEYCHDPRASDEQIKIVGAATVEGAEAQIALLHHSQREHVWDAIGLACVALHRHLGVPVRLPQHVEQALALQKLRERATPKKPKQKRLYSRAARAEIGERSRAAHARKAG